MALTNQPYLPLYIGDWMTNTKLKMCSPAAHGVMITIMCLMHKSEEYGVILLKQKFKQTDNQIKNFALQVAKITSFDFYEIEPHLEELVTENVLKIDGDNLICSRMVKDAIVSSKRALAGSTGGKKTQKVIHDFAKAKFKANPENEIESDITNTLEKEKEEKKVNTTSQIVKWDMLLSQFNEITGKSTKVINDKVKHQILARLREGYSKQDILDAMTNCFNDDYHKETNHKFLTLEFISRSDKMEKYSTMKAKKQEQKIKV